ncbi:MAG: isoprenylcysteine carboxylmethyltransferase family protein [Methylomonas sp.]|jgi:protein-S-isoprenylcysteine O-methyltransferase Ste14
MTPKLQLAFITVAASVIFFGLAVLGWGGFDAFMSQPAFVAAMIVGFALAGVGLLSPGNISSGIKEDRGNRWFFIPVIIISLLGGYLPAYTDRVEFWVLDGGTVRWVGVVLFALGGALRIWPVFVLGDRFSGLVAIQPGHTLVTTGVYSKIRNPSYLGLLINMAGWALVFRSGFGLLLAALMIPFLHVRMRAEEALLRAHFGSEYDAYYQRTARLLPGVY